MESDFSAGYFNELGQLLFASFLTQSQLFILVGLESLDLGIWEDVFGWARYFVIPFEFEFDDDLAVTSITFAVLVFVMLAVAGVCIGVTLEDGLRNQTLPEVMGTCVLFALCMGWIFWPASIVFLYVVNFDSLVSNSGVGIIVTSIIYCCCFCFCSCQIAQGYYDHQEQNAAEENAHEGDENYQHHQYEDMENYEYHHQYEEHEVEHYGNEALEDHEVQPHVQPKQEEEDRSYGPLLFVCLNILSLSFTPLLTLLVSAFNSSERYGYIVFTLGVGFVLPYIFLVDLYIATLSHSEFAESHGFAKLLFGALESGGQLLYEHKTFSYSQGKWFMVVFFYIERIIIILTQEILGIQFENDSAASNSTFELEALEERRFKTEASVTLVVITLMTCLVCYVRPFKSNYINFATNVSRVLQIVFLTTGIIHNIVLDEQNLATFLGILLVIITAVFILFWIVLMGLAYWGLEDSSMDFDILPSFCGNCIVDKGYNTWNMEANTSLLLGLCLKKAGNAVRKKIPYVTIQFTSREMVRASNGASKNIELQKDICERIRGMYSEGWTINYDASGEVLNIYFFVAEE